MESELLRFLRHLPGRAAALLINGDLFDFWFEWRSVIPRQSFRVLAALAELREQGVEVLLVAGNHDCWGGEVLRRDVGIRYHVGLWVGSVAGWRARVEHGDGLRPHEDRGYRMLRRVLRHRAAVAAFRVIHPDLGTWIASGTSHTSRRHAPRDEGGVLRAVAVEALAQDPALDLLLLGHSHVAQLVRAPSGGVYANAGSWLDEPTFLRVSAGRIELRRWDGSAEGEQIDSIDRRPEKTPA